MKRMEDEITTTDIKDDICNQSGVINIPTGSGKKLIDVIKEHDEKYIQAVGKGSMITNIEDTIHEQGLPVNTIAMANRLIEILKENDTNNAVSLKTRVKGFIKFRQCLWLINQQVFGQMVNIDMMKEWEVLTDEFEKDNNRV